MAKSTKENVMSVQAEPPSGECRASITSWRVEAGEQAPPTVSRPGYRIRLRARCPGCGHEGPLRSEEEEAVEDACDHAFPDWRDMPVMEPRPYEDARRERWYAAARAVYPRGWFEREGPVREYRPHGGMRPLLGAAPGGGYSVGVACEPPASPPAPALQQSLFG
ncbi:DUF6349 family protein [Nonomuraea recticatena]